MVFCIKFIKCICELKNNELNYIFSYNIGDKVVYCREFVVIVGIIDKLVMVRKGFKMFNLILSS